MNKKRIFFGLLSLGLAINAHSQSACFSSPNDNVFEAIGNSRCITKGDFDNDGDIDIVMGNYTGTSSTTIQRLYLMENAGNGIFQLPVSIQSGSQPLDVQSADFDNDGNLDLVVVNFNLSRMAVLKGNGDGTFQVPVAYPTDFGPNKITIGDFNNNGFDDIAVSTNAGNVNVFLANTASPGTFNAFTGFALPGGSNPSGINNSDFNGDGNLDIVTANNGTGNVSVLIGDGAGSFSAATDYVTGIGCFSVVVSDLNGDGNPDLVSSNEDADNISVLINSGTGSFNAAVNYTAGDGAVTLQTDDFNNDANMDIVTVNNQDNTISVFLGNGDGTLQPHLQADAINSPRNLVTGDFNGDGNSDIALSCLVGQVMPVYVGDGTGVFSIGSSVQVGTDPTSMYSADFNADGNQDFVVTNSADNTASIHLGDGAGAFNAGSVLNTGINPSGVHGADFDNNGSEDIVVTNYTDNNLYVYLNSGGVFSAPVTFNSNATPIDVKTGDFNADGNADIAVLNENNQISVLIGDGAGGFSVPATYATGNAPSGLDVGDVNGDGYADVAVANSAGNTVGIHTNDGTGVLQAPTNINVGNGPSSVTLGDLNMDGFPDVVSTNFSANNITVSLNNGSGLFSPFFTANHTSNDTGPMEAVVADFSNDGNNDLAVINLVSVASTGNVALFIGDGAGGLNFETRFATGMDPRDIVANDFNNDGLLDLGVANFESNDVSILLNTTYTPTITALGPTTICAGDSVGLESTTAPFYYWSNGEETKIIYAKTAGTYSVEVSSGNSGWCSFSSNTITVSLNTSPTLSFTGSTSICVGSSTTLVVSGADTYSWSGGLGTGDTKTVSPTATTTYTVTGTSTTTGCSSSIDITVIVNPLPDAGFAPLDAQYCQTSTSVTLVPNVSGGTFSGPGVSVNTFDPASAGVGIHTITYTITDGNGCTNASSQNTEVVSSSIDATFSGLNTEYCVDDAASTLTPATTGGTFTGNGTSGSSFDPAIAGAGTHTITYEVTSGGCTGSSSQTTTVNPLPDPTFSGLAGPYCANDAIVSLTPTTTGGTFTGPGISGSNFDPSAAGAGTHTITYVVTDVNGCTNSSSETVTVNPVPDATFSGLAADYCVDAGLAALTPATTGGTFSGNGMTGSDFDPSVAGTGTHTITYSITDVNGCTSSTSETTTVNPLPDAGFGTLNAQYCLNDPSVTLVPNTTGGTFTGTGMTGSTFDPLAAGVGTHTITYSITDVNGCTNTSSQTTTVDPLPDAGFTGLASSYCFASPSVTLTPNTTGGTFTGNGITGSSFDPGTAGIGIHTITYTIMDGNGCTNSTSSNVEVYSLPDATFTGLDPDYCVNDVSVTLVPNTTGGTFSGNGMTGDVFDPGSAGLGSHTITYNITDGSGCSNSSSQTTTVNPLPDPTFTGLAGTYCANDAVVALTPTTTGGTFSGPGISVNNFDPAIAGAGTHTITYTVTDVNGCTDSSTETTTVNPIPDATFTGLAAEYCIDAGLVALTPTTTGGTFTGNGVTGSDFDPSVAGTGTHTITYSITDVNGCTSSTSETTTVNPLPDAGFGTLNAQYCLNDPSVTLVPNTTGGTFTGTGMTGSTFDPLAAGVGTHTITYSITDVNGCTNTSSQTTNVDPIPDASFTGLAADYCVDAPIVTLTPTTTGGTFSGLGMTGSNFDPSVAGVGTHTIMYTITDVNGCINSSSQTTEVNPLPDASFTGLATDYCVDAATVTLTPTITGGTFSGSGIAGNNFDPATAGVGTHTITYTLTDANGCVNSSSSTTTVDDTYPDASFTTLDPDYCLNDAAVNLVPVTSGGVFSGGGVVGSTFDPSAASVGSNTVTYTVAGANTCVSTSSQTTQVNSLPDATYTGLDPDYCVDAAAATLTPTTASGAFTGSGISGSTFDPSVAGVGTQSITYSITDANGCSNSTVQTTEVNPLPDASFTGLAPDYCVDAAVVALTPSTTGGTFSGLGVSGNNFDPGTAGVGTHTITYSITDVNGCSNSVSETTTVNPLPDATFAGLDPDYCFNTASVTLVANVTGGTFTGPGIAGTNFDPADAGVGVHTITYSVTDVNGCMNTSSQSTEVYSLPDSSFTGLDPAYCIDAGTVSLTPATTGGTFSGLGISGSNFDPSNAGVGTHTITYQVTDANGCTNTSNQTTTVDDTYPDASFTALNPEYCVNEPAVTLVPITTGGVFSGNGVVGNTFDPGAAIIGTNTVTYTVTGTNMCTSVSSQAVTVNDTLDAGFSSLDTLYCTNATAVTLVPNSTGGTFSGSGISGNSFDPVAAGIGTHVITYEITTGAGCTSSSSQTTEVDTLFDADFNLIDADYCADDAAITLVPNETGGTFNGPGVTGNIFDPSQANIGSNTITYEITGPNGCFNSSSQTTVVNPAPDATFTGLASSYCENESVVTLVPNQTGGSFSGYGIIGTTFDPNLANIGNNTITYAITNSFGCSSSSSQIVKVSEVPDSIFTGLDLRYCDNESAVVLTPNEVGGTFTGAGVAAGNMFYPSIAPLGSSTVTYTITNADNCTSSSTQTVEVFEAPNSTVSSNDLILEATEVGAGLTYQWINCKDGQAISGETNQTFEVTQNGTYAVVTSNGNCSDTSNCTTVYFASLEEENTSDLIKIYPNPNNGKFNLEINSDVELSVYNSVGQEVYSGRYLKGVSTIDLSEKMETGVYLLKVVDENGNLVVQNIVVRQ